MSCKPHSNAIRTSTGDSTSGRQFWRDLEELAESPEVMKWVEREFPSGASMWGDALSRRKFLALMGASLALAGVSGCSVEPAPEEDIVPYVRPPETITPGRPLFFATTMTVAGDAVGLLVESHMGRPIKVEGNPDHPASLGATSTVHQASVLTLYDPDRSQAVTRFGQERTWEAATAAIRDSMNPQRTRAGRGLRILTPSIASPTLHAQLQKLLTQLPDAKWCVHDPIDHHAARRGAQLAFGEPANAIYDFSQADVILSLDCDFLGSGPGHLRYAHDFIDRRRVRTSADAAHSAEMNRLYVVEPSLSCTGAKADHRMALRGSAIGAWAHELSTRIINESQPSDASTQSFIDAVAQDLTKHRGRSLVLAGERQPAEVHALAHVLNARLGNVGRTVRYMDPVRFQPSEPSTSLADLADEMERGDVELLLIFGGNPVYSAPADVAFGKALEHVGLSVHLSLYQDETSHLCHWHLPEAHYLEAWSDARAFDGTASIAQPLIKPLYQGRSAHEVLSLIATSRDVPGQQIVKDYWRDHWRDRGASGNFEDWWQVTLHDGVIKGSESGNKDVSLAGDWQQRVANETDRQAAEVNDGEMELEFLPDPTVLDGEFANNGWLQELPKPVTLLTWGNAAIVSPATAKKLGLERGTYVHGGQHGGHHMPVVELSIDGRRAEAPLWIMPGHADNNVSVYLGNGRTQAGRVGNGVGFDAYALRTGSQPWFASGVELRSLDVSEVVACTQVHHSMDGRELVRSGTLRQYRDRPESVSKREHPESTKTAPHAEQPLRFYERLDQNAEHKWGMAIDLTSCIGCNACIIACQAENNIPVVGKEQVSFGREMHWLRVDRYLEGPEEAPTAVHFQPVPCMHCENAPCEYVCPVEATVHSAGGLNDMIYNRCVGTRFCSNNCPYKVRRFNFLAYADFDSGTRRLQFNPDVTVRSRGVMEKCTYCVQRIRQAEIDAQTEQRPLRDGEILTACQAVCPGQAITFGDINDPQSEVRRWKESPLHYSLLEETNTAPRTTYLAELRNPNSDLDREPT